MIILDAIDFMSVLKIKREIVWKEIQKYLPDKEPKGHYKMIREYPERRGKYVRPSLVLLSCEAFGGDPAKALLTAAAMQVSEEWLLIHDDVEDDSDERRGKPCLHKMYGKELAINAGDALHLIMWRIIGDNIKLLGNETGFRIFDKFYDIFLVTCEGQYLECSWIHDNKIDISEEEYYKMIDAKAGLYTISGPIQLGAIVAGVSDDVIKKIEEFGIPFGRAFQITDDTLNLSGEYEKYGKEIGGDILEGKRTLILIHLLRNCTEEEKEKVVRIYSKKREDKTKDDISYVINLMKKYGSIDYAKAKAREFAKQSKEIFDRNFKDLPETDAKKIIRIAIDFVVNREV